jgi:hypothetical protein
MARISIWPPQLSLEGFAPTFFRHVPIPPGANRWILVAGPARAGRRSVLVGLALQASEPVGRNQVSLKEELWPDKFRVQFVS